MEKNVFKRQILEKLLNKKIVLVGAGAEAAGFYNQFSSIINIEVITANYFVKDSLSRFKLKREVITKTISELEVFNCEDYFYIIAIDFDVSCIAVEFQLEEQGLLYGSNYVYHTVATPILSEKKILLTAGDCLLDAIATGLSYFDSFTKKYYVRHYFYLGKSKYFNKMYYRLAQICDLYVMNRHMINPYGFYFDREELPQDCQVIYMATPEFRGYWPQTPIKESTVNRYHIFPHDLHPVDFVMREDMNINKAIESNGEVDVEELVCKLRDENFYSREYVLKNYDKSINVIKHAEEKCDIKISDYFMNNVSTKKTAKEYSHYQNDLILEMCRRLIAYLEPNLAENVQTDLQIADDILPFTEMPVYPSVAKHLNLSYIEDKTKYKIRTYQGDSSLVDPYTFCKVYYGIEELTFSEYIRRYYDYCMAAKSLMEVW